MDSKLTLVLSLDFDCIDEDQLRSAAKTMQKALLDRDTDLFGDVVEKQKPTNGDGYTREFLSWYKIYPKKQAKPAAFKAFKKSIKKIAIVELMKVTEIFAEAWKGRDLQHCPMPSSWLNGDRFNDDTDTWFITIQMGEFEEGWNTFERLYPKKTCEQAKRKFKQYGEAGEDMGRILQITRQFLSSDLAKTNYAPSAFKWLRDRHFDDDPTRWKRPEDGSGSTGNYWSG
jgi:hypothetical protein